ncbi:MAG TPA: nucleotidyltransferase family protein [Nostocaceae cyanobacterium]|nr:nucleotidyltransferase family protein [Nostocaceae cyanobacterium]
MQELTSNRNKLLAIGTRPENELLLCCARTFIDAKISDRIQSLLKENIDWTYLIKTAENHGIVPLLYFNLNSTCPKSVPQIILDNLRTSFQENAAWSMSLTGELIIVLKMFADNEIPVIPFKGATLAACAYHNLVLRQFSDLDILVHEQDFLKAKELLIYQGYQLCSDWGWQLHFISANGRVNLDLHQSITPKDFPSSLTFEYLWKRLQPVCFSGITVSTLAPEDLLLFLCINVARDCWEKGERLIQICDIAELIRVNPEIDWQYLIENSKNLGCQRILFLGLLLADDLLEVNIPKEILQTIYLDKVVKLLSTQMCCWLFCELNHQSTDIERKLFYFRVRERLQDKLPYFVHLISLWITPSHADQEFLPLPPSLSFLYYLVRLVRVIKRVQVK